MDTQSDYSPHEYEEALAMDREALECKNAEQSH